MWKSNGSLCFSHLRLLLERWHHCCLTPLSAWSGEKMQPALPYMLLACGVVVGGLLVLVTGLSQHDYMPGEYARDAKKCQLELFFWLSFFVPVCLEAGCIYSLGWFCWLCDGWLENALTAHGETLMEIDHYIPVPQNFCLGVMPGKDEASSTSLLCELKRL